SAHLTPSQHFPQVIGGVGKCRSWLERRHVNRQETKVAVYTIQKPGQTGARRAFRDITSHGDGNGRQVIDGCFLILRGGGGEASKRSRRLPPGVLRGQLCESLQVRLNFFRALLVRPMPPGLCNGRPEVIDRLLGSQPLPLTYRFRTAVDEWHNGLTGQFEQRRGWSWSIHRASKVLPLHHQFRINDLARFVESGPTNCG